MTQSDPQPDRKRDKAEIDIMLGEMLFDPRLGDAEDDGSSPKQRSLLAIAGSLLAEISLPKLALAWTVSILLPAALLGSAPLVATIWFAKVSRIAAELTELGAVLMLIAIVGLGSIGWRPLWRTAEMNFWSLNALAVQPGYAFCREALRHLAEHLFGGNCGVAARGHLRAISAAGSAVILCVCGLLIAIVAWPASHWVGTVTDLLSLHTLVISALANAVVVVSAYFAVASLVWGVVDASMDQPIDLAAFAAQLARPVWRIAHLSDIHIVGEHYGFRIESGGVGHAVTDELCASWPVSVLAQRMIILPGNHDLNIVDRLNPARLDLPFSPGKRWRQMRTLSAIAAVQGDRVRAVDPRSGKLEHTLALALAPHRQRIAAFADSGQPALGRGTRASSDDQFPMIMPPITEDGIAVAILNSNAETHFSFTNALGLVSAEQARKLAAAVGHFAQARWIVALHHHLVEYPRSVAAFSERIGTALINGSWFIRSLKSIASRTVVMHGHRHIDWIGTCGKLNIISAPSPVMGAKRYADIFSYPGADIRRGRATLLASAGTRRDCRRERT